MEGVFEVGVMWELVSLEVVFVVCRFWFCGCFGVLIIMFFVFYFVVNFDVWG